MVATLVVFGVFLVVMFFVLRYVNRKAIEQHDRDARAKRMAERKQREIAQAELRKKDEALWYGDKKY